MVAPPERDFLADGSPMTPENEAPESAAATHEAAADSPSVKAAVLDSRPGRLAAGIGRPAFLATLALFMTALSMALALSRKLPDPPPVLMSLPDFTLTNERGAEFGSEQLKGKVWIASFMFTSCPTVCPKLMERMAEIQHRTRNSGAGVHLVSISVDPETDTPERLSTFARRFKASPYRWTFLTGEQKALEETVVKGFKLAMGKDVESAMQIFHSERFVLVDGEGRIRGYYEADKPGIDAMMRAVGYLINVH